MVKFFNYYYHLSKWFRLGCDLRGLKSEVVEMLLDDAKELSDGRLKALGDQIRSYDIPLKRSEQKDVVLEFSRIVKQYISQFYR